MQCQEQPIIGPVLRAKLQDKIDKTCFSDMGAAQRAKLYRQYLKDTSPRPQLVLPVSTRRCTNETPGGGEDSITRQYHKVSQGCFANGARRVRTL